MGKLYLRKATPSDSEFAYRVKKAAFKAYVDEVWGWDDEQQRQMHERRFDSQDFFVIQWEGVDAGILAMVKEADTLRINQLFILPEYQGRGIGTACINQIEENLHDSVLTICLQVLKVNKPAFAFFQKLGFREVETSDTHILMEKGV